MSMTCPRCNGKKEVWRSDLFDMDNMANGYWDTCPRCSGSGEVADDDNDDDNDDDDD